MFIIIIPIYVASFLPEHYLNITLAISIIAPCGAHEGSTSVTLAGVHLVEATGTNCGVVQLEVLAQPGGLQGILAVILEDEVKVNLLEDCLVLAGDVKFILAPTGGKTIPGLEVVLFRHSGQADHIHMGGQNELSAHMQEGNIIGQVPGAVLRVEDDMVNITILVRSGLGCLLCIPFTATHLQIFISEFAVGK